MLRFGFTSWWTAMGLPVIASCERAEQCEHVAALVGGRSPERKPDRIAGAIVAVRGGNPGFGSPVHGVPAAAFRRRARAECVSLGRVVDSDGTASATPFALTRLSRYPTT